MVKHSRLAVMHHKQDKKVSDFGTAIHLRVRSLIMRHHIIHLYEFAWSSEVTSVLAIIHGNKT